MRLLWDGFRTPRRALILLIPFFLGVFLTYVYVVNTLASSRRSFTGNLGLRQTSGDHDLPFDRVTKQPKVYILGDITGLQRTPVHQNKKERVLGSHDGVKPKYGSEITKQVRPGDRDLEDIQKRKKIPKSIGNRLPLVKWTKDEVLEQLAAFKPPSETELSDALTEKYGFNEKPPGSFIRGWRTPCWIGNSVYKKSKLKCLPAFYMPGFPKSGTMDLWFRLKMHPQLRPFMIRETNWWTRVRYQHNESFSAPNSLLGEFSGMLGKSLEVWGKSASNLLLGEGTPATMWMAHNEFRTMSSDKNITDEPVSAPRVLTPHLIKKYTPRAKFVVIMRNPADRIFSHFCYYGNRTKNTADYEFKRTPARFHRLVVQMIAMYQDCFARRSIRDCAYDFHLSRECNFLKIRIDRTLYAVYISDWMKIFPREQFHFVRTEDYSDNTAAVVRDIHSFLRLKPVSQRSQQFIASRPRWHTKEKFSFIMPPMWNETRKILDDFFRPFNEALATILNDQSFLWKKQTSGSATT